MKNGDAVEETEESVEPDRDDSVGYDSWEASLGFPGS